VWISNIDLNQKNNADTTCGEIEEHRKDSRKLKKERKKKVEKMGQNNLPHTRTQTHTHTLKATQTQVRKKEDIWSSPGLHWI